MYVSPTIVSRTKQCQLEVESKLVYTFFFAFKTYVLRPGLVFDNFGDNFPVESEPKTDLMCLFKHIMLYNSYNIFLFYPQTEIL